MKRNITTVLICVVMLAFCACASKEPEATTPEVKTFAEYTDRSVFQTIPAADPDAFTVQSVDDFGDDWDVMMLKCNVLPTYSVYKNYVALLESTGFQKIADNGDRGIDGAMFAATLTKDNLVVALTFIPNANSLYIAAATDKPISPRLMYNDSYTADHIPDAKTTLTMHGLHDTGNCYVIQLKNGHYIVNDGGYEQNTDFLVQSLKDNAPDGEIPVVEAWFISHEHPDHLGALFGLESHKDELIVEGFYYNEVSSDVVGLVNMGGHRWFDAVKTASICCKNSAGEQTPIYRMHAGERYYFSDISVEVLYTCEQVKDSDFTGDLNASCAWLMYYIEGQKFLLNGDAESVNMEQVAGYFDQSFFDVDIMSVPHHGYNMYAKDPGYFKAKTLIYAHPYFYSDWWPEERKAGNLALQEQCEERISWADGDKKLTFPYTVGSVETLPSWYPELTAVWSANLKNWAAGIGIDWAPAEIVN